MRRTVALLLMFALALPVAACGQDDDAAAPPTSEARAFCEPHQGVRAAEVDGDATCADGTQFEAGGEEESATKTKKKTKKKTRR